MPEAAPVTSAVLPSRSPMPPSDCRAACAKSFARDRPGETRAFVRSHDPLFGIRLQRAVRVVLTAAFR
jgi:hypothetical protein